ncbi:MAG: biopolymer transporter ExbD [Elusimicrobia bacterium]|nr:biopolymer transporter ExbD [Elusimicrobiota bacterium]
MAAIQGAGRKIVGINITPLVDIVLVLLIITMATAELIARGGIDLSLPKTEQPHPVGARAARVELRADKTLRVDERRVSRQELRDALAGLATAHSNLAVTLAADQRCSWSEVADVLDLARGAGVRLLACEVEPK